jgi:uncharacterized protein (DUF697 family)
MIHTLEELDRTRRACRRMVRNRARAAAALSTVPLPGFDIAGDIAMLLELIPAINREFGLAPEQLEQLDGRWRIAIQRVVRRVGARFAGMAVTQEMITAALGRMSAQLAVESAVKYVPVAGSMIAAGIAYHAFRAIAYAHVDECTRVLREVLQHAEPGQ